MEKRLPQIRGPTPRPPIWESFLQNLPSPAPIWESETIQKNNKNKWSRGSRPSNLMAKKLIWESSGSRHSNLVGRKNYLGVGTDSFIKGLTLIEHKSSDILPEIKKSDFSLKDDY